jgi:hypothetical protein
MDTKGVLMGRERRVEDALSQDNLVKKSIDGEHL